MCVFNAQLPFHCIHVCVAPNPFKNILLYFWIPYTLVVSFLFLLLTIIWQELLITLKCTILKKNDDGDLIFYLCNFTVGYYITIKNKHLLCVTVHLHSCFVRDLLAKVDLIVYFVIFPARSIASKGKSDVKESTDSSTTLEDDDKGNLFALSVTVQ